jgi:hypothetical protein
MRLPYQQVAMEVIELVAPELAVALDWTEEGAGWGMIHLHKWALARCPDHEPPSANDTVRGPNAAKLIARAARYHGDPEAFVDACAGAQPSILERVEGGIRIRGLDRYDAAWGKSHPKEWAAWRLRNGLGADPGRNRDGIGTEPGRIRPGTGPDPEQNRAGTVPPDADADADTDAYADAKEAAAAAAEGFRSEFLKLRKEVLGDTVPDDKQLKPKQVKRLQLVAIEHQARVLRVAAEAYFQDRHWRSENPPCPLAGFIHPDQLPQYLSKAARVMPSEARL